ncbi:MAG: hypothetical protein ACRDGI_08645, partial [Candidatus Limnocylindrales bacterium]
MTLGDEPRAILPDDADAADLIVGTPRLPGWVGRVPRVAWLFLVLALLDGTSRIIHGLQFPDLPLTTMAAVLLGTVTGVGLVLLPAALLLGGRASGRSHAGLLQGAIALAAAELVRQFGP